MKTILRLMTVLMALMVSVGAASCASNRNYVEPKSDKQTIDLFSYTYTTGKSLTPEELYLYNDRSAEITYRYSATSATEEAAATKLDALVEELNRKIYTEETYEAGSRMFWREEGDVWSDGDTCYARMRIVDLTKVRKDYYQCKTVGEFADSTGTSSGLVYEFRSVDNSGEMYRIVDMDERDRERLRIWDLRSIADDLVIRIEGTPLYFYDDGKKTIGIDEEGGLIFSQNDRVYLIYQETAPLNVTMLILGIACGVLLIGAVAGAIVTVRRQKARRKHRS